jgi:hypothetical protein
MNWPIIVEWGQRAAAVLGVATPVYTGLSYLNLTPVTERYVTSQLANVRKDIEASRVDTLDTRKTVMGLAKNDLLRERQALETAIKIEKNPLSKGTWYRRLETINTEIDRLDKGVTRIEEKIEELQK